MKGATEYIKYIQKAAQGGGRAGFQMISYNQRILNGHFLFVIDKHSKGKTLEVYLLKKVKPKLLEFFPSLCLKEKNAMLIYGQVRGRYEINEEYGFLVEGVIKEELQKLFDTAINEWNAAEREEKETAEAYKMIHKEYVKMRTKEFEKIFTETEEEPKENLVEEISEEITQPADCKVENTEEDVKEEIKENLEENAAKDMIEDQKEKCKKPRKRKKKGS